MMITYIRERRKVSLRLGISLLSSIRFFSRSILRLGVSSKALHRYYFLNPSSILPYEGLTLTLSEENHTTGLNMP